MEELLTGAVAAGSFIAALFFLRFWHNTRDRFFLYFAAAFCLEGIGRVLLGLLARASELEPEFYLIRLVAYGLILVAIWQKNRGKK